MDNEVVCVISEINVVNLDKLCLPLRGNLRTPAS